MPGLSAANAQGERVYVRPLGKSGGHGVGWSEITPYTFLIYDGWDERPVSIADPEGTEIDAKFASDEDGELKIILAPIELLGLIIKPLSLMIRLYANISAGHIVLMSLIALIFIFKNWIGSSLSFVLAFSISIIEILVALLQAYIFTVLSALYFGFAVEEHDENDDH